MLSHSGTLPRRSSKKGKSVDTGDSSDVQLDPRLIERGPPPTVARRKLIFDSLVKIISQSFQRGHISRGTWSNCINMLICRYEYQINTRKLHLHLGRWLPWSTRPQVRAWNEEIHCCSYYGQIRGRCSSSGVRWPSQCSCHRYVKDKSSLCIVFGFLGDCFKLYFYFCLYLAD